MKKQIYIFCCLIFLLLCSYANYQITKFDGHGYAMLMVTILFIVKYYQKANLKLYIFNPSVIFWGILMGYQYINAVVKDSPYLQEQSIASASLISLTLMILVSYLYNADRNALYKCLIISTIYYLLIAYIFGDTEKYDGRLSGFIYTTQLGQLSGVTCIIISMYIFYKQKINLFFLYLFPIFIMLLAGARNGFMMVVFAMICLAVPYIHKNRKTLFTILILIVVLFYIIQESNVLERLWTVNEDVEFTTGTIWDSILGDRILYYVMGYQNFVDNPFTGIGLLNFMDYNYYKYPIHSEIMTHIAEGGTIGLILYLCFKFWYIKKFKHLLTKETSVLNQCFIAFISLAVLGLTARIYHYSFFFILYGIINGEIIRLTKYKHKNYESCNIYK